jgi:hypothetical protein
MPEPNQPASTVNPAVARCTATWTQSYQHEFSRTRSEALAQHAARRAFSEAMPPLIGYDNIRDFIACCAQGVLLGALEPQKSAKLLYAAQVALSSARYQPAQTKSSEG